MDAASIVLHFLLVLVLSSRIDGQSTIAPGLSFSCDFENGTCNFIQSTDDDFDWQRQRGPTDTEHTGPEVDHTTGSSTGYYMYAEASTRHGTNDRCALNTPAITSGEEQCLEFYYNMRGTQVGSLKVKMLKTDDSSAEAKELWRISGTQGEPWHRALVTLEASTNNFMLIFEATIGSHYQGDIAIDDVSVQDGHCPYKQLFCDFEDQMMCGYTSDPNADRQLTRRTGSTPSRFTGPSNDHTLGNGDGYYMYMETSGVKDGATARLISPVIVGSEDGANCLIIWYHMYGEAIGDLNVYIRNVSDTALGKPVWTRSGNRGNMWRAAEIDLGYQNDFQVVIETTASGDYRGDIAFDDVQVTGSMCPGEYVYTNISSVTCTFESPDICSYQQDKTDGMDWRFQNGATRNSFTGPDNDHTHNSSLGFYMVFSGSYWRTLALARLISPDIEPTSADSCVEFWYHMYGADVEGLNVYVVPSTYTELPITPNWNTSGNQGDYWHRASVSFPQSSVKMKLVFEAKCGSRERDDVAIDDVTLYASSPCPQFVTDAPPPTTQPIVVSDIGCDFETGFCNYSQAVDDIFDWKRYQGSRRSWGYLPKLDHTKGSDEGYYALMDCSNWWLRFDDRARLISPLLSASSSPRCVKFFYYKYSQYPWNQDYLNLYIKQWGHRLGFDPDWTIYGAKKEEWIEGMMDIPPSTNPVQIVIEASVGTYSWYCDVAVDDISIHEGACPIGPGGSDLVDSINCDFESEDPWCGYEQGGIQNYYATFGWVDQFDWLVTAGPTGTKGTGPTNDHTYKTSEGHYMYVESSQPRRPGDNAIITTPRLKSSSDHLCLQFYYHMSGADTAWLVVYTTLDNQYSKEIARFNGQGEDDWRPVLIDIPPFRGGLKISFEGRVGKGFLSDIAIDDITTYREPCGGFPQETFCEFEYGFDGCMYDFENTGDLEQWKWFDEYSGPSQVAIAVNVDKIITTKAMIHQCLSSSSSIRQNEDLDLLDYSEHLDRPLDPILSPSAMRVASGSYMYTSGTGDRAATISSNRFKLDFPRRCVIFRYVIKGPSANLLVMLELSNGTKIEVTTLTDTTSGEWKIFGKDVGRYRNDSIKINFVGTTSNDSIIAVDDVGVGNCNSLYDRYGGEPPTASVPEPLTVTKSYTGMIIGIIFAVVVATALVVTAVLFLRSRGVPDIMHFRFDNSNDPTLTSKNTSTDPGIANPTYDEAKLTSSA